MPTASLDELVADAREVRARAYAPYSKYPVGAALRDDRGRVFAGVNVENVSFGATICAERGAVMAMVADGGARLTGLAVATRDGGAPCGMCLQVLAEFAGPDLPIALVDEGGTVVEATLEAFVPRPFVSAAVEREA